jgi:HEAT repeat protein
MGLFDFFSKDKSEKKSDKKGEGEGASKKGAPKKSDRELARLGKLVATKLSQNYDRQEAIEELGKLGTAEAAALLLKRFDWLMEPSITDQEEKEAAARGIVAAGEEALDPIREYCKKAESLTWPLKVLRQVVPEERYVEELLSVLDLFDTEYVRNPEPKIQLITLLEEFPSEDVRVAIEPFVQDASEPVRFSAVTTVFAMKNEESAHALIAALEEEESLRVKNRLAQNFVDLGWDVPEDLVATAKQHLPPGYRVDGQRIRKG